MTIAEEIRCDQYIKGISPQFKNDWICIPQEESQIIIHCTHYANPKYINGGWVNICPKTYLKKQGAIGIVPLEYVIGVPVSPEKHFYKGLGESIGFTLVFCGVPDNWDTFSLIEEGLEGDGLRVEDIKRNELGVYYVRVG
ncbi:hypothetical protein [Sediminibacterium sp.]|uniref:hypothetical protein n=1 Tax=Sediminibacterium sp. TaxID=1917865 RepID=UPI003F6FA7E1